MANASIKMTFTSRLPQVSAAVRQNVAAAVAKATEKVQANAQLAIQTGPKTGRYYRAGSVRGNYKTGGSRAAALKGMGLRGRANDKTGKTRFVIGSKLHRASAPGEAPASDTSLLANSIQVDTSRTASTLTGEVTVGSGYGAALEFGSSNGKVAARPFLQPAVDAVKEEFERDVAAALKAGG